MKLHLLEKTSEKGFKSMSAVVNKKCALLSSGFFKTTSDCRHQPHPRFLEEIKHHWGSFSVYEMLQEKLHHVAVSNVDTEFKIGWLKLWNGNRFDKDTLHFPKSPLSILHLMIVYQSLHIGHIEKKLLKSFRCIISSPLQLPAGVAYSRQVYPNPGNLRLSTQYTIVNSKA